VFLAGSARQEHPLLQIFEKIQLKQDQEADGISAYLIQINSK
jgi:hypothetical protein